MATFNLRKRLEQLEMQIAENKRLLRQLEQNRTAVERELHATAVFPVATLPNEVTAEIFNHWTPHFDVHKIQGYSRSAPSIALAAVCRAWRNLALATPSLWSTLHFRFDIIPRQVVSKPDVIEDFIHRWLARAGQLFHRAAFGLLSAAYSRRVRYLELNIGPDGDIRELGLDLLSFPLLEHATLCCEHAPDPEADLPRNVFGYAPRLHDLCLRFPGVTPTFTLPWLQLTKFDGELRDLELFTLAPNLTQATCRGYDIESSVPVTHHNLISLTAGSGIIQHLTLPSLQYLYISHSDSLELFLKRSSPPLVSLSVRGDEDSFREWYPCIPFIGRTLRTLEIAHVPVAVMSSICHLHTPFHGTPNLQNLSFKAVDGGVDLPFVVRFLYSQLKQLRTFRLVWASSPFMDNETADVINDPENETIDTVSGHLSWLSSRGMVIYLGTGTKNYATMDNVPKNVLPREERKIAATKLERRAREKLAKKEKKRIKAEKRAAGELDSDDEPPKPKKRRVGPPFGGRVVVDLGFDEKMTEKEVQSLCSQLGYTYSANRQAGNPFALIFTSLNGKSLDRLESLGEASYKRWTNTEWWLEGYERLWEEDPAVKQSVVYLTADSDEELTELKPDETYVIGGICDHNRLKNECLNKAQASGIRTARLPIGSYLSELRTRKVLTVNQAFEILVHWVDTRDWESAFHAVIPKRKFEESSKSKEKEKEKSAEQVDSSKVVVSVEELEDQAAAS
ncbi:SAM-dependent MTase TRM10-type domain-containing protein [Mycena venus]|uniref:tRNA (guanine(9)-N1)-methyltransferase n=1 Tax=Mycena venus TaxID=2733690 RepID=A0A8H6Y5T7_9AGAR|nr:SAM-dependent MTase TRM10-type domain-containing protein [Mycena venus]